MGVVQTAASWSAKREIVRGRYATLAFEKFSKNVCRWYILKRRSLEVASPLHQLSSDDETSNPDNVLDCILKGTRWRSGKALVS